MSITTRLTGESSTKSSFGIKGGLGRRKFDISEEEDDGPEPDQQSIDKYNEDFNRHMYELERGSQAQFVRVDVARLQKQTEIRQSSNGEAVVLVEVPAVVEVSKKYSIPEDHVGIYLAFVIFAFAVVLSFFHQNLENYARTLQWPIGRLKYNISDAKCDNNLGFAGCAFFYILTSHHFLNKNQDFEGYSAVIFIAVLAGSLGNFSDLKSNGLSASFWAIILGIFFRYMGLNPTLGLSGEYFIKAGIVLLCMDFVAIVDVGGPGLVVAWVDTSILFVMGTFIAQYIVGIDFRSAIGKKTLIFKCFCICCMWK